MNRSLTGDAVQTAAAIRRRLAGVCLATGLGFLVPTGLLAQDSGQDVVAIGQQLPVESGQEIGADGPEEPAVRAQPPEDFIDLVEPQTNFVDIYYGGLKVATGLATFTPSSVQLLDPLAVMPALADVTDAELVLNALTGPLPTHSDLLCLPGDNQEACGVLSPEVAGVIFDRNRFRLSIFVNPNFRTLSSVEMGRYLEPTDTGPGLVSRMRGVISGGKDQDQSYIMRNNTVLAWMDNRLESSLLYDDQDHLFLDRGVFAVDRSDWRGASGLFRTEGLDSASQEKILGVGLSTQLDTRVDLDLAYAVPIILFLPNRSKVDILRDGRLMSSKVYEAGNQTLDTSALPNGSYDITLRIQEIGGDTTEETRFFSKNAELPPADTPQYVFQIGALVDDSTADSDDGNRRFIGTVEPVPILRAGTLHRLGENWGAFLDVMSSNEELLLEFGGVLRERPARLRGSLIATTAQDAGFTLRYSDRLDDQFGYSMAMRQIFVKDSTTSNDPTTFDPFTSTVSEFSGGLNYSLLDPAMTLGFQGSYNRQDTGTTWSAGPSMSALLWQSSAYDFRFAASATQGSEQFLAIAQLVMSYRDDNWSALASMGFRVETGGDTGPENSASVGYLKNLEDGRQFQFNTGVFRTVQQTNLSATGSYVDPLGAVAVNYERTLAETNSTTYSGEVEFDLVGNTDGFAVTGFGGSNSAIIVALDGEVPEDAQFDVIINGSVRARLDSATSAPIVLEPYRSYDVSILSHSQSLFDYELEAQRVTLFPGSVATMTWHVLRILPVFGRVVRADGDPVRLAKVEGAHDVSTTDAEGYFQAQVNGTEFLEFTAPGQQPCRVTIGDLPHEAVFYDLGTVVCEE